MGFFSCRRRFVFSSRLHDYSGFGDSDVDRCGIRRLRECGTGSKGFHTVVKEREEALVQL